MTERRLFTKRYTRAGASPGAMVKREGDPVPIVRLMSYSGADLEERLVRNAADLPEPGQGGAVTWIDVQGLGDTALLEAIGERYGLHHLAMADVANTGQRPKVEEYDDSLFFVVRMLRISPDGGFEPPEQLSMFLGSGFIITFQERPGDCLDPLRDRIRRGKPVIRTAGADYLACMVVDAVVDACFPVLEQFGERLESLETRVVASPSEQVLAEIFATKRELMGLRRAIWPARDFLGGLLRERPALIGEQVVPYIRDVHDHAMHLVDLTETYRELSQSFLEVYLSSVSQRTNEVMRVLTVIATIFIPLTFIAGVYGMNFDASASPLNMPELRWPYGYAAFWGVSLFTAAGLLIFFRYRGWLGGPRRRS